MKHFVTIAGVLMIALLAGSYGGAVHPVGDSLAVFRLAIALLALIQFCLLLRHHKRLALVGIIACAIAVAGILWHKREATGPGPITVYQKNMLFKNDALAALAQDILETSPDIVMLQEVSVPNTALLDMLSAAYPHQHLCRFSYRSGVAVLSRLEPLDDPFCHRDVGLAAMRVTTDAGPLWALSLHLSWPFPLKQARQIRAIEPWLRDLSGPIVLGGDFNMVPWSDTLRRAASATRTTRVGVTRPSFQLGPLPLPIDHVLAPGGGTTELRPFLGSDHRGLVARVHITPAN